MGLEKVLNTAMCTYRLHQKELDQLKRKVQLDEPFTMPKVAAKYDVSYKTLRGHIHGTREGYEAYAGAQRLTPEYEKVIAIHSNSIKTDLI